MSGTVSIIVPCYNVAPYVDVCMNSLVNQTLRDIEIICVNDGSTDGTLAALRRWAEKDARIRVIDQKNRGVSSARNAGLAVAGGEYIGFVDPDDYVDAAMYARLTETARRYDADAAACGYISFSGEGNSVTVEGGYVPEEGAELDSGNARFNANPVWRRMGVELWNKVYRREFLQHYKLRMRPELPAGEDYFFWMEFLPRASRLAVIPDQLYFYRRKRAGSLTDIWDEDGALRMERLEYITARWKENGCWEMAARQGWLAYAMRDGFLAYVSSPREAFFQLDSGKRAELRGRYRKWLKEADISPDMFGLDQWDCAFCRLLAEDVIRDGFFTRLGHALLSRCRGRRGRYYRLRALLLRSSE